jgi:hypothetical protein
LSQYEDRAKSLRSQIDDAEDVLGDLPEDQRAPFADEVKRLEGVLAYVKLAVGRTAPELISDSALNEISALLSQITGNPAGAASIAPSLSSQLIDVSARLPAASDRASEQRARDTAATFQRSARSRLAALKRDFQTAQEQVDARSQAFQQRLDEFEATIATQRQTLDQVASQQTEAFTEAQTTRQAEFQTQIDEMKRRLDESVSEVERMAEETAQLVGAIAVTGTAGRYANEADDQRRVANRLRGAAIAGAVIAALLALAVTLQHHPDNATFGGKLAVSLLIGAIATYLAKQSGRHRRREERARGLQLELTAFGPFIEPLPQPKQEDERVIMTRKTFGRPTTDDVEEEETPTTVGHVLGQLRRRRDRQESA